MQHTVFYNEHLTHSAKMVEFCGWNMPINYGSQIKEHEAVRTDAGMFDVAHMVITDIRGSGSKDFLRYLLSNDVAKLEQQGLGKALYSGMLNELGCVIDDLIVYYTDFGYRIISNAGTAEKDQLWMKRQSEKFNVELILRDDLSILAVQGPKAITKLIAAKPELADKLSNLKPFSAIADAGIFYARTGYTGEDGLEIVLPNSQAVSFWRMLVAQGVIPCGLAARDTLRLEAGMNLYGHDMDESISPLECNMDWVVDLSDESRSFIGRDAYQKLKTSVALFKQVGLVLLGRGVLREGQKIIHDGAEIGVITSGTFSPSLKQSIAIARIKKDFLDEIKTVAVDIRGNLEPVKVVKLPFVRRGKRVYE
ncbi:MAG: aminomethyltransferase [Pseudomonadota bacterium]|nr:aminomethyltransferase [Pseudomonadota bacterium]